METQLPPAFASIAISLIPILITYFAGILTGFLLRLGIERLAQKEKKEDLTRTFIGFAIVIMWILTNLVDLGDPNYSTPLAVHLIMGSLAGAYFRPIDFTKLFKR